MKIPLQAYPGETLIVQMDNALSGLTIRDYFMGTITSTINSHGRSGTERRLAGNVDNQFEAAFRR
jgi:hypothetical protein